MNKKALELFTRYNKFVGCDIASVAREYGMQRNMLSYIKSIHSKVSEDEFKIVVDAVNSNSYIHTSTNERTRSFEMLVRILIANDDCTIVVSTDNPMKLYLMYSDGYTKIGIAKSILNRINSIQTGNPHKIELLAEYLIRDETSARALEADLHDKYSAYNTHGEWFKLPPTAAEDIDKYVSTLVAEVPPRPKKLTKEIEWNPDAKIVTEAGKAWYYETVKMYKIGEVGERILIGELANYKFKLREGVIDGE